jgi:cell division protein FtsB
MYDKPFCVPFQEIYEDMVPDEARSRYAMVLDGEVLDSKRVKYLTKDSVLAKEYLTQITGLNNWIAAYKGQIDGLRHELATTKYQLDQLRYGTPAPPASEVKTPDASELNKIPPESETLLLSGVAGRNLLSELGRRIRRRAGTLFGRSRSR